ncbi:MAG: hypothetical protein ACE15F_23595 [bacterium]
MVIGTSNYLDTHPFKPEQDPRIGTDRLIRRIRGGDAMALEALFKRYYIRVVNYIRWFVDGADV